MEALLAGAVDTTATADIEVFATDITSAAIGEAVKRALRRQLPCLSVSVDLDDCDHILRVQAAQGSPALWQQVVTIVQGLNIRIAVLPD